MRRYFGSVTRGIPGDPDSVWIIASVALWAPLAAIIAVGIWFVDASTAVRVFVSVVAGVTAVGLAWVTVGLVRGWWRTGRSGKGWW